MKEENKTPETKAEQPMVEVAGLIEVDKIAPNTVIVIKLKNIRSYPAAMSTAQRISDLYGESLENKGCSIIIVADGINIELVSEQQMNQLGWQKKEKSNLILPS